MLFKSALKRLGWYDSLKSVVRLRPLSARRPPRVDQGTSARSRALQERIDGIDARRTDLRRRANEGNKAEVFRRLGARVVCVDPDRRNVDRLRRRFKGKGDVTIVDRVVSRQIGRVRFNVFEEGSPFNTLSTKWVETLGDADKSRFDAERRRRRPRGRDDDLGRALRSYGGAFLIRSMSRATRAEVLAGLRVRWSSFRSS